MKIIPLLTALYIKTFGGTIDNTEIGVNVPARGKFTKIGSEADITIKQIATPSSLPATGYILIYPKSDGKLYMLDAAGTEAEIISDADTVLAAIAAGAGIDVTLAAGVLTIDCETATTTNAGILALATNAEAAAGTNTTKAITPDDLKFVLDAAAPLSHLDDADGRTIIHIGTDSPERGLFVYDGGDTWDSDADWDSDAGWDIGGAQIAKFTSREVFVGEEDDEYIKYTQGGGLEGKFKTIEFSAASIPKPGRFGAASDYVDIAATGQIAMVGDSRVKNIVNLGIDGLASGGSAPSIVKLGNWYGYAFTIGDDGFVRPFEIPYDWDESTPVTVKIHWYINEAYAAHSGEVRWNATYTACAEGTEVVDAVSTTVDFGDVNIHAVAKTLMETTKDIPASALAFDDVIAMQITRVGLSAGANPTAEPVIVGIELTYVSNKLGEAV